MDAREKAAEAINSGRKSFLPTGELLALPELEAYFREKFYNELSKKKHADWPNDERGAIELALRDAYAAGANAARCNSLFTAMDYAELNAKRIIQMLVSA